MFFYSEPEETVGDAWNLQARQTWEPTDVDLFSTGDLTQVTRISSLSRTLTDHNSLTNPLTTGGEKCEYVSVNHSRGYVNRFVFTKPEVVGLPETTAVSIRATIRDIANHGGWFLCLRGANKEEAGGTGYYIGAHSYVFGSPFIYYPEQSLPTSIPDQTWKRFRIDLIPQIQNGVWAADLIRGYVADANDAEASWQLMFERVETAFPASNAANNWHQLCFSDYSSVHGNGTKKFYIDNLEIYTGTDLENL